MAHERPNPTAEKNRVKKFQCGETRIQEVSKSDSEKEVKGGFPRLSEQGSVRRSLTCHGKDRESHRPCSTGEKEIRLWE